MIFLSVYKKLNKGTRSFPYILILINIYFNFIHFNASYLILSSIDYRETSYFPFIDFNNFLL